MNNVNKIYMELADCYHSDIFKDPPFSKSSRARMGKLVRGVLGVATLFSLPIILLHIRPANNHKSPDNSSTSASSTTLLWEKNPLVDTPNISFASTPVREHTMGRELMDSIEADQLPVLFPNGVRNITKQVQSATVKDKEIHRTVKSKPFLTCS